MGHDIKVVEGYLTARQLEELMAEQQGTVEMFCERFNKTLLAVEESAESGMPEPMYIFDDSLGGYSITGIEKSLEE